MVYVNIPYNAENDRIDRELTARELKSVDIGDADRYEAFEAIYNKRPRGVQFKDVKKALLLEAALSRLGVGYSQTEESDYKYETWERGQEGRDKN